MTTRTVFALLAAGALLVSVSAGCNSSKTDTSASAGSGGGAAATTSPYDGGPRANSVAADPAKAALGEKLFSAKGCTACHGFGKRGTGPDLQGVTARRTEQWLNHWLTAPDEMQKSDAIARELLAQYPTQMPNLHLTPDEVAQLIDYLRLHDASPGAAR